MASIGLGKIASLSGRYWAMDRDNRWDRVQRAYDCLTGRNIEHTASSATAAIQHQYDHPENKSTKGDEFCPPTAILTPDGDPVATIGDGDSVIFFNFRGDRPRELTRTFIQNDFAEFDRGKKLDIYFATLSLRNTLPISNTRSKPPTNNCFRNNSGAMRISRWSPWTRPGQVRPLSVCVCVYT